MTSVRGIEKGFAWGVEWVWERCEIVSSVVLEAENGCMDEDREAYGFWGFRCRAVRAMVMEDRG